MSDPRTPGSTPEMLRLAWQNAPELKALDHGDPGSGKSTYTPDMAAIKVDPQGIVDAENAILRRCAGLVEQYNQFRGYVEMSQPWIFAVAGPIYKNPTGPYTGGPEDYVPPVTKKDVIVATAPTPGDDSPPLQAPTESDKYFGMKIEDIHTQIAQENDLLQGVADTMHLVGGFVAVLNGAAQKYADVERVVTMPAPGVPLNGNTSAAKDTLPAQQA